MCFDVLLKLSSVCRGRVDLLLQIGDLSFEFALFASDFSADHGFLLKTARKMTEGSPPSIHFGEELSLGLCTVLDLR